MSYLYPTFCGVRLASNAKVSSFEGSIDVIERNYARSIGAVVKPSGAITKTITLDCRFHNNVGATRADIENYMNNLNEAVVDLNGNLQICGNTFTNAVITSIDYGEKIVNNYLEYSISFLLGKQDTALSPLQSIGETSGRMALFTSIEDTEKMFYFMHNVDITRNLRKAVSKKIIAFGDKNYTYISSGGYEDIKGICWITAKETQQNVNWSQTVLAYLNAMMDGPVGKFGTFTLDTVTINNMLLTGVSLEVLHPTSARYSFTAKASLQC